MHVAYRPLTPGRPWEHGGMSTDLGPSDEWSIDESQVEAAKPKVRALHVKRYEMLWGIIEGKIKEADEDMRPLDPRYLELGIKVLKEEAGLYRLTRPPVIRDEEEEDLSAGVDRATLVLEQLAKLEERRDEMRKQNQPQEQVPEAGPGAAA